MKTIQISPYRQDCRIEDNKVIGTMNGRKFVFEIPKSYEIPENLVETMINNFCEAIALSSKSWQVETLLNQHWNIEGGKFYELSK